MLRDMRIAYHVMSAPGPLGLLFLGRTERGLRYLEFLDKRSIKRTIESHRAENPDTTWEASLIELKPFVDQLEGYFCGALTRFDLALDPIGSDFQLQVWRALLEIPFGETRTYGQIAKAIGQPRGSRAVGLANNQNPLAILIPCHRVIGADGNMTGYGGGIPRKRWLLAHEAHFGAMAGVTLDLFAATGALPATRIASGDGPPLGTQRHSAASERASAQVAAKAAARTTAKRPAPSTSRAAVKTAPRAGGRPVARSGAKAPARSPSKSPSRTGTKLAARPARTPRRTAR